MVLDEPTTGLDPAIAANIKDIIKKEKAKRYNHIFDNT